MRWSLFFLVSGFVLMCMYVGWEQGAFDFKHGQMALPEVNAEKSKKETAPNAKIAELANEVKEPLKSTLVDLINNRKLDEAVALYEKKYGKQETSVAYSVMLGLVEKNKETTTEQ
jgi:hypothetical protein